MFYNNVFVVKIGFFHIVWITFDQCKSILDQYNLQGIVLERFGQKQPTCPIKSSHEWISW
jgi:hypothetical protein